MDVEELARKQEIREALKERLHERELQAARYGMSADPSIPNEIKRLKAQIKKVEREIKEIEGSLSHQVAAATVPLLPADSCKQATPLEQQRLGSQASSIPDEVLATIRAQAEQAFPTDFSTRRYKIDGETQAWRNLQRVTAPDVPSDVLAIIMEQAARDFPDDFSTRLYKINNEVRAWRDLQAFQAPDLPAHVLTTIVAEAAHDFPGDFSTRLYKINQEVNAWRNLYR
jgi:hypothetical protein